MPPAQPPIATSNDNEDKKKRRTEMMELIPPAYSVSSPRFKCRVHFSDASDQSCVFQDLMRYETLCQEGLKACPWEFRPSSAS